MGFGLALGGGGAKGAFEIGAWQAMRELGIELDAVTGTSIGAVNAAFIASDDFEGALRVWESLDMAHLVAFSENRAPRSPDLLSRQNADLLVHDLLHQGWLNTGPFRELIGRSIDERRVRESRVRYGLMTAELPRLTAAPMWIGQIPAGQLHEYIMASTRFPGLRTVSIDGRRYIDGGIVDNLPIAMLRDVDIRQIVAVDLSGASVFRSPSIDNIQLTYIHDSEDLGGSFDLTPAAMARNRRLGYLDAMKAFGRLSGDLYSFERHEHAVLLERFGRDGIDGLEQAAAAYGLDRRPLYRADEFIAGIRDRRLRVQREYEEKRQALQIDHKLQAVLDGSLKALRLAPSMRLAFLLEATTRLCRSGSRLAVPMRHFRNLDRAVLALDLLDREPAEAHE